jgi:hypothetical protein
MGRSKVSSRIILTFTLENSWGEATSDNSIWTAVESVIKDKLINVLGADHVEILAVGPAGLDVSFKLDVSDPSEMFSTNTDNSQFNFSDDEDDEDEY